MPYTNVGKGFLMKVDQKRSERGPDYSGKLELDDGQEIQVSGWVEESKSGKKYLSLSLQVHEEERPERGSSRQRGSTDKQDNWNDDVPF
jgi:uncharacterized protein (DUF736 family)